MALRLIFILSFGAILFAYIIISGIKKSRILINFALVWILYLSIIFIFIFMPKIMLFKLVTLLGFETISNFIFLLSFVFLLLITFNLTIHLSILKRQNLNLIQELSLLKKNFEEKNEKQ